jgi:hypothetical protein
MGRIGRSWELIGQSITILKSDMELMWLPIFSAISCVLVSIFIFSGGALFFLPEFRALRAAGPGPHQMPIHSGMWFWLFLFYLGNYFVVVFFNVALVSIAANRLGGGQATLNDGLQAAWERKGVIFQWALLAATVGVILRAIEERVGWIGRLVIGFIGIAWSLATFFVVPILAFENLGPVEALYRSADLFKKAWGEQVAGGFSFGILFALLALPGLLLPVLGQRAAGPSGAVAGTVLLGIYWLMLAIISAAAQGIFTAALYHYATTGEVAGGFRREQLAGAWQPKQ